MAQEKKAFRTIAAGGKRGTILHYVENNQTVADGELILIDAGAQWQWYNGDISRTFPVNGKFTGAAEAGLQYRSGGTAESH